MTVLFGHAGLATTMQVQLVRQDFQPLHGLADSLAINATSPINGVSRVFAVPHIRDKETANMTLSLRFILRKELYNLRISRSLRLFQQLFMEDPQNMTNLGIELPGASNGLLVPDRIVEDHGRILYQFSDACQMLLLGCCCHRLTSAVTRGRVASTILGSIQGRGTVVTGRIERGKVKVGEETEIVGFRETRKTVVTGVEMFKKQLDEGLAGDNAGLLLRGIAKEDVERGMVLAKPGSITPHTNFKGEIYVLSKEEGGRHTPFFKGYRPQFYFRTTDVTGVAELPEGVEMVMPGDNVQMNVELITPIACEEGLRFAIREGGRTVGAGVVTAVSE